MIAYEVAHVYNGRSVDAPYWRNTEQGDSLKAIWETAASQLLQDNGHTVKIYSWQELSHH